MPILDGSVGRNGWNKTHDVAVVQAALQRRLDGGADLPPMVFNFTINGARDFDSFRHSKGQMAHVFWQAVQEARRHR